MRGDIQYNLTSKIRAMNPLATTRMSSKGQIVIPEEVRKRLGLEAGVEFVVVGEGDAVILKVISPPSKSEFRRLLAQARTQARKAGLKKKDLEEALRRNRAKR
ncbi:MAG TPA: AbrB/MazE/SpoVT family DNA-binding domain-containing protein [Vicinamibacteria bacterium]